MSGVLIRTVATAAELETATAIQSAVFVAEQGIPGELTLDELNAGAVHVLALRDGTPIGTARLFIREGGDGRQGEIARVAVLPGHRRAGIGRQLVAALEAIGVQAGVTLFRLHPRDYLETFYGAMGYRRLPDGDHTVAGYPLITMCKAVTSGRRD